MNGGVIRYLYAENKYVYLLLFALLIPILLVIQGGLSRIVLVLLLSPAVILFIYNTRVIAGILVLSVFLEIYFQYFYLAEYLSILLLFSFIITSKSKIYELKNFTVIPFVIFLFSVIPSYLFSPFPGIALLLSVRLLFFFIVVSVVALILNHYSNIKHLVNIFLLGILANAIHVIFLAVTTGNRVFGFTGIMYVDLVSLGVIICFINILYLKKNRFIYSALGTVFLSAQIFTQTRGVWILTGITLLLISLQAFFNSSRIGITKIKMFFSALILVAGIVSIVLILQNVNPGTFERVTAQKSDIQQTKVPVTTGSLATRFFIWTTAWNAFYENPLTGTGLYTFPLVSADYASFNRETYKMFVDDLTAHTTILALLSETGIIGFTGFCVFLFTTLYFARQNVKKSGNHEQWFYSQLIFWISVYISFSMVITDAWLWGVLLILWGVFIGMSVANSRIIDRYLKHAS